jgi:ribosomal protein L16 Arg81 hydroxylase
VLDQQIPKAQIDSFKPRLRGGKARGMFIGAAGASSRLHAAPFENLFVQVWGRKRWVIIPASNDPLLRPIMSRSNSFFTNYDPERPDYDCFPEMRYIDSYEVVLEPGDVLYNPPSFWHQISNPTANIGVGFRWLSTAGIRANLSQLVLVLLATNPSFFFMVRNAGDYGVIAGAVEEGIRKLPAVRAAR